MMKDDHRVLETLLSSVLKEAEERDLRSHDTIRRKSDVAAAHLHTELQTNFHKSRRTSELSGIQLFSSKEEESEIICSLTFYLVFRLIYCW